MEARYLTLTAHAVKKMGNSNRHWKRVLHLLHLLHALSILHILHLLHVLLGMFIEKLKR